MGAELSRADGRVEVQKEGKQTDASKLVAAFCNFGKASKNQRSCENAINMAVILLITEKFRNGWKE